MRVLSVVPRYAVTVGSLQGGTVIGKTPDERGKLHHVAVKANNKNTLLII